MSVKVFVYGTLRTGDCRHGIDSLIRVVAPEAWINGFDMLDLGGFPGLVPNEEKLSQGVDRTTAIRGEVHEYEDLERLDRIEGYDAKNPEKGLYNRVQIPAFVIDPNEVIEDCWVYLYNARFDEDIETRTIQSGDWFTHRNPYPKQAAARA